MRMTGNKPLNGAESESAEPGQPVAVDRAEFARQFQDCRPHLVKLCERILQESDGARDAVNEAYVRAYQNRGSFDGANFPGWLSRIAQRICIDRLRREARGLPLEEGIEPASPDNEVRILTALQIRSILATLP